MELEFLGTGSGQPSKFRNVASLALKLLDERNAVWLFDVGEATQHQILKTTIRPRKIEKIFISHLHGDHIFGLPGLLSSRSFQGADKTEPLTIYGPKGIRSFVNTALRVSDTHLSYPLSFVEIEAGTIFEDQAFRVIALPLRHRMEAWGFRIEEKPHPGELLVERLQADQVPAGPVYGQLKAGQTVTLADGRVLDGKDYLGPDQPGRTIAIVYDTMPTEAAAQLADHADLLVHEATYGTSKEEQKMARAHGHSTVRDATKLAYQAQVGALVLTHVSARYLGPLLTDFISSAKKAFPGTYVARDFDVVDLPMKKAHHDEA